MGSDPCDTCWGSAGSFDLSFTQGMQTKEKHILFKWVWGDANSNASKAGDFAQTTKIQVTARIQRKDKDESVTPVSKLKLLASPKRKESGLKTLSTPGSSTGSATVSVSRNPVASSSSSGSSATTANALLAGVALCLMTVLAVITVKWAMGKRKAQKTRASLEQAESVELSMEQFSSSANLEETA